MWRVIILGLALNFLNIKAAYAYVGPGLGLGALGVIIGILLSVILALVGIFWYPLKRLYIKYIRKKDTGNSNNKGDDN